MAPIKSSGLRNVKVAAFPKSGVQSCTMAVCELAAAGGIVAEFADNVLVAAVPAVAGTYGIGGCGLGLMGRGGSGGSGGTAARGLDWSDVDAFDDLDCWGAGAVGAVFAREFKALLGPNCRIAITKFAQSEGQTIDSFRCSDCRSLSFK